MRKCVFTFILNSIVVCSLTAQTNALSTTWLLDRTDTVGGYSAIPLRKLPAIIETAYGKAALFSCYDSTGFLVSNNPVGSDTAFTVEVFFRPDSTILSGTNNEQRFIHIRNVSNDNRRILMELRQLQSQRWLLDTYIKSELSNLTLVDSSTSFTSGEWHHVALSYANGVMRQYVDGKQILSGPVTYLPVDVNGKTSIGARQDPRSWFNGAIRMVKVTRTALTPDKFTIPVKTGVGKNLEHPHKIQLNQNYPNPFNPTTKMSYELPVTSYINLKVYDIMGREVAQLVDGMKDSDFYTATFDGGRLASGIYFARFSAQSRDGGLPMVQIRKMVLMR
jgi:hypothetical protein